jgi:hypothetical protein
VLHEAVEKFVPQKYVAHSTNLPKPKLAVRYPPKIRRAIARKCCLWRHLKANPNDGKITTAYKQAENKCKQLIHSFELEKAHKVIDSDNIGTFYKFANKKILSKNGVGALRSRQDDGLSVSDEDRANAPNSYFGSVCEEDD